MNQQQQLQNGSENRAAILSWLHFLCRSLAAMVEVFLHKPGSFGQRYLGLPAAAAVLVGFFYTAFFRGHDIRPVLVFLVLYVFMCAVVRIATASRMRRGGAQGHSMYSGTPVVQRFACGLSEETVKRICEPMIVFLAGSLTLAASEPLGTLLMLASFGLFACTNLAAGVDRTRALDMHDALLDQQRVGEHLNEMRGQ
ncbi:MAG: hypothetical protein IT450_08335 [Phycisphaerales bacterium]|nr:hypothetical protein [Phycisphaerales bacterium]